MSLFIKNIFLVQLCLILAILYPTSLANLVVEVGTRHSHQTLFIPHYAYMLVGVVNMKFIDRTVLQHQGFDSKSDKICYRKIPSVSNS